MKTRSPQSGSTLVVTLTILLILTVIVAIAAEYTTSEARNVQRSNTFQNAIVIGDSALDVLFNQWRTTCRTNPAQQFATSAFSALPTPSPFPGLSATNFIKRGTGINPNSDSDYDANYTISNYKIIAVDAEYNALASTSATPEPQLGQLAANVNTFLPTTPGTLNYIASADVTLSTSFATYNSSSGTTTGKNIVAKLRRVFSKQQISPWNYAIFYVDPLEIHPGPLFTVTGWVHTNSNLYTGHNTLTFADKVTYASDWFVGFMPGDNTHPETPAAPNYPSSLPPARDQALQPFGLDSTSIFNSTDANPNNDSYHELIEPPVSGYTDPLAGIRYWDQASVIVQISDNNSSSTKGGIKGPGGYTGSAGADFINLYTVSPTTGATTAVTSGELYNLFATSGALTTNQTIQDNREGTSVRVSTLDVSKLITGAATNPTYAHPASNFQSNPIVYIYDTSSTATARRAVRIKNGSSIPSSGLTVASNGPVYVQGDFNTGGTGAAVPSNNPTNLNADGTYPDPNNPPNPTVNGYTRAPCSIVADAVNILSSSFSDAETGPLTATPTTVNTALVAGTVATNTYGDGAYSGGAENFPRFLEDWTNKTLTYYGSMVELYQSKYAVGEWGKGNVYSPPPRQWYFDNNFKFNPPPGSLMLYSYVKGRWSLQ